MIRESLIRSLPEIAFALLFGGGLVLGGDAALAGLPKVLDAAVPNMAAQAGISRVQNLTRFALPDGFAESRFTPQVLYPVAATPLPGWLTEAIRNTRAPLRGDAPAGSKTKPVIAICIDDLGEDLAGTDKAMALP